MIEICLEGIDSVKIACENNADRIELCANLLEGGTTPSRGTIFLAKQLAFKKKKGREDSNLPVPLMVMIRPRGGDFHYTHLEFQVMKEDIRLCGEIGVTGVVLGLLLPDGRVDVERTSELVRIAQASNLLVTFHRAFDMSRDAFEALETLISIGGIQRILTSGQDSSVLEGLPLINELIERAGKRIIIMPGCGINERNLERIRRELNPLYSDLHMALPSSQPSAMAYRNNNVFMGVALTSNEYDLSITSGPLVKSVSNSNVSK